MKKILVLLSLLNFSFCFHAMAFDSEHLIRKIQHILPENWSVVEIVMEDKPHWTLSESPCLKITLKGPNKTGFKYFDARNQLILASYHQNEALEIWIGPDNYDTGWTLGKRIKNRFNICPVERPATIYDGQIRVFAWECVINMDDISSKTSPEGTVSVRHMGVKRSWKSWRQDLEKIFNAMAFDKKLSWRTPWRTQ